MANRLSTAAGRCGFLAGFSYYEFSRLSEANAMRVPVYPTALLGAFTFSVVCNALWAWITMYINSGDDLGRSFDGVLRLARLAYNCYQAAFLCYAVGLSKMVAVFNPAAVVNSHTWGLFFHMLFLFEQYYLVVVTLMLFAIEYRLFFWQQHFQEEPQPEETLLDPCTSSITQLAASFGGRAVFMVGFIQHALARYQYHPEGPFDSRPDAGDGHRSSAIWLNAIFWHCIILAAGCLLISVFLATIVGVYVQDMECYMRARYFYNIKWAWTLCRGCFRLGMYLMLMGAMLTGWGCTNLCNQEDVPDGACYAKVAYVPFAMCGLTIVLVLGFIARSKVLARRARAAASRGTASSSQPPDSNDPCAATLKRLALLGNTATIAAGFVMYNIATFDTDVINAPSIDPNISSGLSSWGHLFLWANWLAFSGGMSCMLCVFEVEVTHADLETPEEQQHYIHNILAGTEYLGYDLCSWLLTASMRCLLLAFAVFGLAKMLPPRVEPAVIAFLGVWATFSERASIRQHWRAAVNSSETEEDFQAAPSFRVVDMFGQTTAYEVKCHKQRVEHLQATSSRALLFGGFAYNAVSFLFRPEAMFAPTYLVGMSLSFMSAFYVVMCSKDIHNWYATLDTEREQNIYMMRIDPIIRRVQNSAVGYVLCFLGAFAVMGYIKLWTYSPEDANEDVQTMYSWRFGWVQLSGAVIALLSAQYVTKLVNDLGRPFVEDEEHALVADSRSNQVGLTVNGPTEADQYILRDFTQKGNAYQKSLDLCADATVFQTGNVFFEILFSAVGQFSSSNYFYFVLSVLTLTMGCVVIITAALLSTWCTTIRCLHTSKMGPWLDKTLRFRRYLHTLYAASLISWQCSLFWSSSVKYPSLYYISAIWSIIGLTLIAVGGLSMCRLRRHIEHRPSMVLSARSTLRLHSASGVMDYRDRGTELTRAVVGSVARPAEGGA